MKWVCTVCGYVYEGPEAPAECPICHVPADKFKAMDEEKTCGPILKENALK